MTTIVSGSEGITLPDNSQIATYPQGWRNRIINGDMRIDQRNAGASVTPTNGQYTLDRWQATLSVASKFSVQQSTTAPAGFSNSLLITSLSAYSVGAAETFRIQQPVEGFNSADLAWGTADAQAVTVSFRVRSSLTGTFGGAVVNGATDYSYPFSYTISAANTWETKTVTIAGPTSGTWVGATNGTGLYLMFSMGAGATRSTTAGAWASGFYASATGATSVVGTNGATFYITGVQLEKGSVATPFEYLDYSEQERRCERYGELLELANGGETIPMQCTTTTTAIGSYRFRTQKRSNSITASQLSGTLAVTSASGGGAGGTPTWDYPSTSAVRVSVASASGLVAGNASHLYAAGGAAKVFFSAEL